MIDLYREIRVGEVALMDTMPSIKKLMLRVEDVTGKRPVGLRPGRPGPLGKLPLHFDMKIVGESDPCDCEHCLAATSLFFSIPGVLFSSIVKTKGHTAAHDPETGELWLEEWDVPQSFQKIIAKYDANGKKKLSQTKARELYKELHEKGPFYVLPARAAAYTPRKNSRRVARVEAAVGEGIGGARPTHKTNALTRTRPEPVASW